QIRAFLVQAGHRTAQRTYLVGDASARSYEYVTMASGAHTVLMNSPYNAGGPILRGGRTYMEIAHLSQSLSGFVAIHRVLEARGSRVPGMDAEVLDAGLLLREDLGREGIIDPSGNPIAERYETVVRLLARLHGNDWPQHVQINADHAHYIHAFDRDAMMV